MTVFDLKKGDAARITSVNAVGSEGARLAALGLKEGAVIRVIAFSLFKSAQLVALGPVRLSMRATLAKRIEVKL